METSNRNPAGRGQIKLMRGIVYEGENYFITDSGGFGGRYIFGTSGVRGIFVKGCEVNGGSKAVSGVTIHSVVIQGGSVVVTTSGTAATDDGLYHLYAQDPVMAGVQGTEVAKAPAGATSVFTFPLGNNTAASMLYKKFTVVGVSSGALKDLSNDMYILNPEAAATHTQARHDVGKKGLLPAAETIRDTRTLKAMGVHQISYNLPVGDMISGGGVNYTYMERTTPSTPALSGSTMSLFRQ